MKVEFTKEQIQILKNILKQITITGAQAKDIFELQNLLDNVKEE